MKKSKRNLRGHIAGTEVSKSLRKSVNGAILQKLEFFILLLQKYMTIYTLWNLKEIT